MAAATPPVAPVSPTVGGAAPHFSAKLGAWVRRPESGSTPLGRCGSPATKRRPGNVSLAERAKIWLAVILYSAGVWALLAWVWHDLYVSGGL